MCYDLYPKVKEEKKPPGEMEPFIGQYISKMKDVRKDYSVVQELAKRIYTGRQQMVYVCGMGFSHFPAEYFANKLMVLGVKCIFSGAEETVGILENNWQDIGLFLAVSKSGETEKILDRAQKAKGFGLVVAAFTGNRESSLGCLADMVLTMDERGVLDDKNMQPTCFFSGIMFMMELVILEFQKLNSQK